MRKISISIIAFFILSLTYAQNLSQQQLSYIHKKSKSLLEEYEQYFNLVGDINEPHNDREGVYIPSFTGLFIDEAAIHYNDLDPEEKTSVQLPITQYALNTMLWYPVGVRNMLELLDVKYGKVQQISSNSYYINVYVNRTISGIFMDEKPNRSTTKLEFRVSFVPNGQLFNNFRIAGVTKAGENIVLDNTPTSTVVNNTSKTNTAKPITFIDTRDGQTYKMVTIGNQIWMAENLNYEISNSLCYNNNQTNCDKFGRLYNWHTAIHVCPTGWRLPNEDDWNLLEDYLGGKKYAGHKMKSSKEWDGSNFSGFDALPSGYKSTDDELAFNLIHRSTQFWSANIIILNIAKIRWLDKESTKLTTTITGRDDFISVRCIKY